MNQNLFFEELRNGAISGGKKIVITILVIIFTCLAVRVLHFLIERFFKKDFIINSKRSDPMKTRTFKSLLKSIVSYALYLLAASYIVTLYFGAVGVTLAGVGGVAIGLGAQGIIKDILSGIFIIFENKYKIGEFVTVAEKSGFVEEIGLRSTVLKDFNGDIHIIPNGIIEDVTNVSRSDRRFMAEVTIDADESLDKAIEVLKKTSENFRKTHDRIIEGPDFSGIPAIRDIGAVIRIAGRCEYQNQWNYESDLKLCIMNDLKKEGIKTGRPVISEGGTHN